MQKFIGTKIIKGSFMNLGDYNLLRGWEIPNDENPLKGGYLVGYPGADGNFDGDKQEGCHYISWSPVDVFEASYGPIIGMSFSLALEALKVGKKVARKGWNADGMHLEIQNPDSCSKMTHPYLFMYVPGCQEGVRLLPWQPAQVDIFSDDWEIITEKEKPPMGS